MGEPQAKKELPRRMIEDIVDLELCQRVLREFKADQNIEVLTLKLSPATSKGDNYTSDMFRARLQFRRGGGEREVESATFIAKVEPLGEGAQRELVAKSSLFTTEIAMMRGTLDRMQALLGPDAPALAARGLHTREVAPALLLLEDLAALGFRMADRRAGLDMDHCLLAVRNLARFHAASAALCEREPDTRARYARGMFSRSQPPEMGLFFAQGARQLAAAAATWPELDPRIPQKIASMADGIYEKGCEVCECREDQFNVINHGDFWVNNMLFKYDLTERPVAHIFVDFQLCVYTSPGIDLNYFFNTSLTDDTLRLHEETLVHEYARSLASAMRVAGCAQRPPGPDQVKAMLRERALYGMIASFTILPILLASKSEVKDLNEILAEEGQASNPAYSSELYRKAMLRRLPKFDQMGLLD